MPLQKEVIKMKIKIFSDKFAEELEKQVNEFIADKKVKDIKFNYSENYYDVMIIYE